MVYSIEKQTTDSKGNPLIIIILFVPKFDFCD